DAPAPHELTLRERGLHAFDELAPPRRRETAQRRKRDRELGRRSRVWHARRQAFRAHKPRDLDETLRHEHRDFAAIALRLPQSLLPRRIANPRRIARARVEQLERI